MLSKNNNFVVENIGEGVDYTEIIVDNASQVIVNFSSMNPGRFERISWFSHACFATPTIQIFLKDENQHFYLGSKKNSMVSRVVDRISLTLEKFHIQSSSVTTVGSSMGGYASIYFGYLLQTGRVVSLNPLATLSCMRLHTYPLWVRKASESNWVDLDCFLCRISGAFPSTLLIHGTYPSDICSGKTVEKTFQKIGSRYKLKQIESDEHGWVGCSRGELLEFFNSDTYFD